MRTFNQALRQTIQMKVAYETAAAQGTVTQKSFHTALAQTTSTMSNYNLHTIQSNQATTQLNQTLKTAASWTKQMGIGLYVIGGAATSIARPLMAVSMIINTYKEMDVQWAWVDNLQKRVQSLLNTMKKQFVGAIKSVWSQFKILGRQVKSLVLSLPGVEKAISAVKRRIDALNVSLSSILGWTAIAIGALVAVGMASQKLAEKFEPISDHMQRAISVSSIAKDQFDELAHSIFNLQWRLGVFTTEEIANMVERMAYAGAVGENFKETAMAIGQIAYVTGMDMAEITRDMARLTSQTGAEYTELANVILRTFAQASITYEETVESFQQAGMLLREDLGMTTSELGAIVVQLEKFGYTGTRAATAIRSLAARSSELKEGLRGSQEIFRELGVTESVEQFKEGEIALDELIMRFGEAGASYGHMVNIFNRRAGVAAAAIAEFPEAFEEAANKIEESSTEILGMYDALKQTQAGISDQIEAYRSLALQKVAFRVRNMAKAWGRFRRDMWKLVSALLPVLNLLNAIAQVGAGISFGFVTVAIAPAILLLEIFKGIYNTVKGIVNLIPGLQIDLDFEDIPVIGQMYEGVKTITDMTKNLFESAWGSITDIWQQESMEVQKQQAVTSERLEHATDQYEGAITDANEALVDFRSALEPQFIDKLVEQTSEFAGTVTTMGDVFSNELEKLKEDMSEAQLAGEEMDWRKRFKSITSESFALVNSFINLNEVSTYLEGKFSDLQDELDEMFGLTREVTARHVARRGDTGEIVGEVRAPTGPTEQQLDMRGRFPDVYENMQSLVEGFDRVSEGAVPIILDKIQEGEVEGDYQSIFRELIGEMFGFDISGIETEADQVREFYGDLQERRMDLPGYQAETLPTGPFEDLEEGEKELVKSLRNTYESVDTLVEAYQSTTQLPSMGEEDSSGGGGIIRKLLKNINRILFGREAKASEQYEQGGPRGLLTKIQELADSMGRVEDDTSSISRSLDKLGKTKIIKEGHDVTVTIDQKLEPNFNFTLEGVTEGTTDIENKIRIAIDRAMSDLEQTVRSSVDPEALERLVIEHIDDEVGSQGE